MRESTGHVSVVALDIILVELTVGRIDPVVRAQMVEADETFTLTTHGLSRDPL